MFAEEYFDDTGRKNGMKTLEACVNKTQEELFEELIKAHAGRISRSCKGAYILVEGDAPILLEAHLDTVHTEPVREICVSADGNILMSPQGIGGDDRCGVYALESVYARSAKKPWLLFTCEEEVGCIGAGRFRDAHAAGEITKALDSIKLIVEVDRRGRNDAVYYDCANADFEKYISKKGYKTKQGSFSDICYVAPELGVAAVNLSSGYYNPHTLHEYIVRDQLEATVNTVLEIVADSTKDDFPRYDYVERPWRLRDWDGDWGPEYAGYTDELAGIPKNIQDEYWALLGLYEKADLEAHRNMYGDQAILELYQDEFGFEDEPGADPWGEDDVWKGGYDK